MDHEGTRNRQVIPEQSISKPPVLVSILGSGLRLPGSLYGVWVSAVKWSIRYSTTRAEDCSLPFSRVPTLLQWL